ncbi:MAG: autotransporter-associated beta strand repeat-containing protein [Burkholderiales bacterium]|jgi:autotransporter-associated beta strand protein|nr:autotransporter-associated beta strand repeat-containing protein [Burkholderiales bacterium]
MKKILCFGAAWLLAASGNLFAQDHIFINENPTSSGVNTTYPDTSTALFDVAAPGNYDLFRMDVLNELNTGNFDAVVRTVQGDITVDWPLAWITSRNLTLDSGQSTIINNNIMSSSGGSVRLWADRDIIVNADVFPVNQLDFKAKSVAINNNVVAFADISFSGLNGIITVASGAKITTYSGITLLDACVFVNTGVVEGNVWFLSPNDNWVELHAGGFINGDLFIDGAGSTLALSGNGTQLYSGAVSGVTAFSGTLVKQGAGTWILDTVLNMTKTFVRDGTLAGNIAANTDLAVAAGAIYDGTGAVRSVNALNGAGSIINTNGLTVQNGAFGGVVSGAGGLGKTGAGTLTLTGNNTYTGLTEVREGALALSGAGTISPLLSLYGGTTFTGSPTNLTQLDVRGSAAWTGNLNMSGQSMNFYRPAGLANNGTMLTVTGTAEIADVTVALDPAGGATLANGNKYTLITATALNTPAGVFPVSGTVGGFSYTVSVVGNTLVLNINALASNHNIPTLGHLALLLLIAILGMGAAFHPSVRSQMARNK